MDRRQFLAAAIGALAGRSVRAQPDCDFADCKLPPINPGHIDAGKAGRFERPAGLTKRPLWSKLSIPEKARLFSTLQKAYQRMSRMCPRDPRSLAFQAWLHQYYCCNHKASHARSFPGAATNIHNTSDFLPWHRAFLFFHERIIQGVSGNKDFRLPVWDWESPCGFQTPWPYDSMPLPVVPCKCSPRRETVAPITPFCLQEWLTSGSFDEFAGPPRSGICLRRKARMRNSRTTFQRPHQPSRLYGTSSGRSNRSSVLCAPREHRSLLGILAQSL